MSCTSYPFEDGLSCTGCGVYATEHHFTGKERDTETGLDYFGARYYASSMGRFLTPDWSASPEAVPYADLEDPQTLNLYGYVRNNPLYKADLDGHDWDDSLQFLGGVAKGVASSMTGGYVGAPSANDSMASLSGQLVGTGMVATTGTSMVSSSGPTALAGLAAVPETLGGGLLVTAGAGAEALAGAGMQVGAANNAGAVISAMALAKPATGKGSVPPDQRDPQRTPTDKQKAAKLAEQGGNCAHCEKSIEGEKGVSHHDPVRHADGGKETKVVHKACHDALHSCGN